MRKGVRPHQLDTYEINVRGAGGAMRRVRVEGHTIEGMWGVDRRDPAGDIRPHSMFVLTHLPTGNKLAVRKRKQDCLRVAHALTWFMGAKWWSEEVTPYHLYLAGRTAERAVNWIVANVGQGDQPPADTPEFMEGWEDPTARPSTPLRRLIQAQLSGVVAPQFRGK